MEHPILHHINVEHRGKTLHWSGSDKYRLWEKNMQDPNLYEYLKSAGWDSEYAIEYTYNNYGFRDAEFDQRPNCLAIGCSFTEGVGLRQDQIWPTKLTNLLGMHVWNLGVGGGAADTCFRVLDHYIKILNPRAVFILIPPPMRVELHTEYGPISYLVSDTNMPLEIKEWFLYDDNSKINRHKNILAMRQLCADANASIYIKDSLTDMPGDDNPARDLMHFGEESHDHIAKVFYEEYINGNS